ncbi:MAG: iron ABC transporter permease [Planctomycetota bacterium]
MMRGEGRSERRAFLWLVLLCAVPWLGAAFSSLFWGAVDIPASRVLSILGGGGRAAQSYIVFYERLPRVLMALLAGGALAVAGTVFQALLNNPLATPHTLGVSAGGSLGAIIAISFPLPLLSIGPATSVQFFAMAGAIVNMAVIYLLARRARHLSTFKLLLAGVTLGLIASAMIMFVRYLSDPHKLVMVDRWLMGGLDVQGYRSLAAVLPFAVPALAVLLSEANALNQLSFGRELAAGRGVDVGLLQKEVFLAGSILTASVVSVAGPIGFVGLIVPHAFRMMVGPNHRYLLAGSFFGGGILLVVADSFARTIFAPSELPVGILTAMMGGPFFLFLLTRRSD